VIYKNVVGKDPDWKKSEETAKSFHEALRTRIVFLKQFTDKGFYLEAILK
jgi:hypothetical protein